MKMALLGRWEELRKVEISITYGRDLLVIGRNGIGKSSLLMEAFELHRERSILLQAPLTQREVLEALARQLTIGRSKGRGELWRRISWTLEQRRKKFIIFLDDFEDLSSGVRKLLRRMKGKVIFIASATRRVNFPFEEELELKPLRREQVIELVEKELGCVSDWVKNLIAAHSAGIPGEVVELCREYKIAEELGMNRGKIIELLSQRRPVIWKRVNLISLPSIVSLAYLLLVLKVLLHGINPREAFTVAIFGYATMALAKLLGSLKRKESEEG